MVFRGGLLSWKRRKPGLEKMICHEKAQNMYWFMVNLKQTLQLPQKKTTYSGKSADFPGEYSLSR
jgi:hypothetical protein